MYGTKYILGFNNDLDEFYEIYFDVLGYTGNVTQLTGTDDVLTLQSTAGDEDRLQPILGTEALINIFVDEDTPLSIADFVASQDNQIRVTVYRDKDYTTNVFQGFIVVEDNYQPFLDPPFVISVRALDGLGLLKGVDLTDTTGLLFSGNFSILSWITQILYKTGQTLNIRTFFNFWEQSFNTLVNPLEQIYLHSITFSQGDAFNNAPTDPTIDVAAQAADDCYTALEKIVRCFRCRLFQEDGRWNLVNIAEYYNTAGMSFTEYAIGAPSGGIVPFSAVATGKLYGFDAAIGKNEIVHPVQEDQNIYLKIATKWIKLTYTYNQSQNKVCNQDFSEGDRNATYDEVISSSIIDASITPVVNLNTQGYDLYCFDAFEGQNADSVTGGPYPSQAATFKSFIRDSLDQLGFSLLRNAVIGNSTDGKLSYIRSRRFFIDTSDILQITYSWRRRVGISNDFNDIYVFLYGDDGTFWAMNAILPANPAISWQQVGSDFRRSGFNTVPFLGSGVTAGVSNVWNVVSFNETATTASPYAKAPVSGSVEVIFVHSGAGGVLETWIKDVSITVLPYLQGSYTQLQGDYNYSASSNAIKQTESDDVEISDSPKRYFKGALLKANGDVLSPVWKGLTGSTSFRFTQIMEQIMYTALYRMVQKIEGTVRGIIYQDNQDVTITRPNGYLNSWTFSDASVPTKKYMLTSFKKDFGTAQWRGVFVETLNDQNDPGLAVPDAYQFAYIFKS